MIAKQISGTWVLEAFQIEDLSGTISDWGKNSHGLLIYTDDGHMSVSINSDKSENILDSILFYAGTFCVEGSTVKHQVTEASQPARIGQELIRYMAFKKDQLILTTQKESFGRAIVVWRRK